MRSGTFSWRGVARVKDAVDIQAPKRRVPVKPAVTVSVDAWALLTLYSLDTGIPILKVLDAMFADLPLPTREP